MIEIVHERINVPLILKQTAHPTAGGHVYFIGTVRNDDGIEGIHYEAYEAMARHQMEKIVKIAKSRWPLVSVAVIHRVGWVPVGEEAVVVAVSSAHRKEAFEACEYMIDTIKHEVPIWKVGEGVQDCCGTSHAKHSHAQQEGVTGVILAGGHSSRFGSNKAFALWKHHTFIEEVLQTMRSVFDRVVIVSNTPEVYRHLNTEMLQDATPHQGPLGGIEVALRECGSLFVVACDMPLVKADDIKNILSKRSQKSEAVIASHSGRKEYLLGYYSKNILPLVQDHLHQNNLALKSLFEKIPCVITCEVSPEACVNINDTQTLQEVCDVAR